MNELPPKHEKDSKLPRATSIIQYFFQKIKKD
jgi:hypothetical protein